METAGRFLCGSWGCLTSETWEGGKRVFPAIAAAPDQFRRQGLAVQDCAGFWDAREGGVGRRCAAFSLEQPF